MVINWEGILAGAATLGAVGFGVWNRVLAARAKLATSNTEVAQAGQAQAEARAGESVYTLVTEQLKRVQDEQAEQRAELSKMRDQLRAKEDEVHQLRMHIVDLEHCLRQHGITPPEMRSYAT